MSVILKCDICKEVIDHSEMAIDIEPSSFCYCPKCGARMGGDTND